MTLSLKAPYEGRTVSALLLLMNNKWAFTIHLVQYKLPLQPILFFYLCGNVSFCLTLCHLLEGHQRYVTPLSMVKKRRKEREIWQILTKHWPVHSNIKYHTLRLILPTQKCFLNCKKSQNFTEVFTVFQLITKIK